MIINWTTPMYDVIVTPGAPMMSLSGGEGGGGASSSDIALINFFRFYSAAR